MTKILGRGETESLKHIVFFKTNRVKYIGFNVKDVALKTETLVFMSKCGCECVRLIIKPCFLFHSLRLTDRVMWSLHLSLHISFFFSPPQSTQWRRQIWFQHFTAYQIKDQLRWSRQVLLAVWASMSVQMSSHRHHLTRLFTGQLPSTFFPVFLSVPIHCIQMTN